MRNFVLICLVLINLSLAGIVVLKVFDVPKASAQSIGLAGNYIMVSGAVLGRKADVVYIIDLAKRKLHALQYERSKQTITHKGTRDLVRDLAGGGVTIRTRRRRTRRPMYR